METETQKKKALQGEGNRDADEEYRDRTREFVDSGKVQTAAKAAKAGNRAEERAAEQAGKARAKELDPAVKRDYDKAAAS